VEDDEPARGAAQAAAASTFGAGAAVADPGASKSGGRALVQYDYEKAEENEIELIEGQYVTNIEMVDEDWWMGQNEKGESGLFPSNYVELVEDEAAPAAAAPKLESIPSAAPPQPAGGAGKIATAQYDYEAAEDNELSFPDGAKISNVVSPGHIMNLAKVTNLRYRSSLMRTGGSASMAARAVSSQPTTCSLMTRWYVVAYPFPISSPVEQDGGG
jgi:hypothetical protein